ncbi:hypothetical protein [Myroides pelagicus]|uniref:DUF1129 family protein n=1 Tax=Myroides pelagicus TaxID=270914 RepID=A0A7K1GMF0_9FLAO|nr:hypothetical protein [Myroides pelagicus]MEC4113541.1 hypothetical protein [Myroides pelagicus]MTH30067.1 hypothetical protein [Myroides pelagicus]
MKTLSTDQIQALHAFVKKHYVEYYDVEIELVDHLANDIENQWIEDETLSFDTALERAFKKFGIFGFSDLVSIKEQNLQNHYFKLVGKEIYHFFHWPKIMLTAAIFYILLLVIRYASIYIDLESLYVITLWTVIIGSFAFMISLALRIKKENKATHKKWLINRVQLSIISTPIILFQAFLGFMSRVAKQSDWLCAGLLLILGLWVYTTYFVVLPIIKREKQQTLNKLINL